MRCVQLELKVAMSHIGEIRVLVALHEYVM
jgi:hypothetical protein